MTSIRVTTYTLALLVAASTVAEARTIQWKGFTWDVNSGSPMGSHGPGQIRGSASNVVIDAHGYLHMKISGAGSTATGAEFNCTKKTGFGSYYYVLDGPITDMERGVVASVFIYGPALRVGGDGEDEIDIEFSKWNGVAGDINADFTFYPNTGFGKLGSSYGKNFLIDLHGSKVNTCRIDWTSTTITASIWTGVVASTASTRSAVRTYTYHGDGRTIPQSRCPMMFNLWTFGSLPSRPLDVTVRDYKFIPAKSQ